MKILQVSKNDFVGGASLVAYGLNRRLSDSSMLVINKQTNDNRVFEYGCKASTVFLV